MHYQVVYVVQAVLGDSVAFKKDGFQTSKGWAIIRYFKMTPLFREENYFK